MKALVSCPIAVLTLAASFFVHADELPPVRTVPLLDIQRYLGKWYEIAAFPMFFQRQCVGDTTAEYALRHDGNIDVTNRCRTQDGFDKATGRAWVHDPAQPGQLKVSFFWPFRSDYWVIGLDIDYRWAVVGNSTRKNLWVLSRTPTLPKALLDEALRAAIEQGYDLGPLRYTTQGQP